MPWCLRIWICRTRAKLAKYTKRLNLFCYLSRFAGLYPSASMYHSTGSYRVRVRLKRALQEESSRFQAKLKGLPAPFAAARRRKRGKGRVEGIILYGDHWTKINDWLLWIHEWLIYMVNITNKYNVNIYIYMVSSSDVSLVTLDYTNLMNHREPISHYTKSYHSAS